MCCDRIILSDDCGPGRGLHVGWHDLHNVVGVRSREAAGRRKMPSQITVDREKVAEFCRRHHIRRLALFGSVLGEKYGPESDVDVLVQFEPGHVAGLITLAGMELELSEVFDGRKVDLRTPEDLSRYFRDEVVEHAEVLYGT
mgnify:CR=1 FL=1